MQSDTTEKHSAFHREIMGVQIPAKALTFKGRHNFTQMANDQPVSFFSSDHRQTSKICNS